MAMSLFFFAACNSPEETAQSHLQKGKELLEKGELDKAILELKTSNQEDKRGETYYYMALLDEKHNNIKSMQQNLVSALALDPDFTDARLKLAKAEILLGSLDDALANVEKVLKVKPDSIEAQLLKAKAYATQGKNDQAKLIVDAVLSTNPDNVDALLLKAQLFAQNKEFDQSLAIINTTLEKDSKNLALRILRIKIYAERKNSDALVADYKELIKLYPDNENFKANLLSIYAMTDKLQEAEGLIREMVDKSPDKDGPKIILLEFFNAKAHDRVIGEYEQWLANDKLPASQILDLSKWMLANNFEDSAEKGLKKIVESEHDSALGLTAQTLLAEVAFNKKQYDVAEAAVINILKANSESVEASTLKARLLLTQNKVDESIDLLNKLSWNKNVSSEVYVLLAQAYTVKKDAKQADKNYKLALEVNPANVAAFYPVYNGYLQDKQMQSARQLLEKALKANSNQPLLLASKAELDIEEKKWDDAESAVQRFAVYSKNKAVPKYLQANILQGKGQYAEAITLYEQILQDFPNHLNAMINLVRSYSGLKSFDKGVAYLEALHAKKPENLAVVGVLAESYAAQKDFVKVKKLYTDQIKLMPKSVPLYLELAKIEYSLNKDGQGAKDVYLKGLENNPDDPALSISLAIWYEHNSDKASARKSYEQLIEKHPEYNVVSNNLAVLLLESGNPEDAKKGLALTEKFKDSENNFFQDTYAWALVKNGQTAEGLKVLQSLVSKEPKVPDFRYHLGVAYLNNGNKATALSELKQAVFLSEKQKRSFSDENVVKKLIREIEHPVSG